MSLFSSMLLGLWLSISVMGIMERFTLAEYANLFDLLVLTFLWPLVLLRALIDNFVGYPVSLKQFIDKEHFSRR